MKIHEFGKGAVKRPEHLKVKDHVAAAVAPFNWSNVKEDTIGNVSGVFGITDQDQGSSSSCTCQTLRYGFKYAIGLDISSEDVYSHVHLPGGGAYLNAPLDFVRKQDAPGKIHGVAPQSLYPDPKPQTEETMTRIIEVKDGDRIRTFKLTYTLYPNVRDIDSAAYAATQHDYIHLGIEGSNTHGWQNPVDPVWEGVADWGHAIMSCKKGIVLRKGVPAIKSRASWCNAGIYCHYLTKDYFANGGVFEIIGVDLKELLMYEKVVKKDGKTFGVRVATPNGDQIIYATGEDQWKSWSKPDSYALHTVNDDGSADFTGCTQLPW